METIGRLTPATDRFHPDPVAVSAGVLAAALGVAVLIGWHTGNLLLIEANPGGAPMPYNAAACFVALGIAMLALGLGSPVWARVGAATSGLLASARIVEYLTGAPLGTDKLLARFTLRGESLPAGPLPPNTAIGFVLLAAGILLLSWPRQFRWRSIGVVLSGSSAIALSLNTLGGYLTGFHTYAWGQLQAMAMHTSVGLFLLGVGVLTVSWRDNRANETSRPAWWLVVAAVAVLVTAGSLWQALVFVERDPSSAPLRSAMPETVLVAGLMVTALLGAAACRAQKARLRTSATECLREQAENETTERRQAQEAVRRAAIYNRSLLEASLDPLVTIAPDGKITDVNRATEEVTGSSRQQLIGSDFSDYFTEPQKAREGYQRVFREGLVQDYELAIRRQDGRVTPVLYNASVYRDETGNVVGVFAAARDITERKRAENESRQAGELRFYLASIVDSSDDAITGKDLNGTILTWNPAAETLYGYSAKEIVGQSISILCPADRKDEVLGILKRIERGERVEHYETERVRKDGRRITVSLTISPIRNLEGQITGASTIARDITERKRADQELVRANAYNRSLIEASLDPLVTIAPDGKITDVNRATEEVTGSPRQALIGTDFSDYFTEPRKARAGYQRVFREGLVQDYELAIRHQDGRVTPVLYNASVYRDETGSVVGVFAAARDITERKRAEQELGRANAYNRSLIEASLDPLVTIAPDGKITDVNRATEEVTGSPRQALIGTDFSDYFTEPQKAREGYQRVFREGLVQDYELAIRHQDGRVTPVLYNASVYRDEGRAVVGVFAAARDISERKRAQEALEQNLKELARSNAELEQFAYVASHDLKEPLRMVANFTQLLAERYRNQLGQEGAEFIGYAVDGATRMQRLIDDLLTYSRIGTRGKTFEPADCNEVLGQAVANLQVAIHESGAVVSHDELPTVMGDSSQLVQLFQNLVGNGIKFRSQAPPRVQVSATSQGSQWLFSVRDNGIGIDPQFAERIFVIFQRLHSRDEYPGTGIGLAVCKKIVERHKGKIWMESEPSKGATFYFTIPVA